ncbi:MAG: lysophospholipid acyltransferase family protein [Gemmatimonas sp.]
MLYEIFRPVASIALRWYYRSVSVAGRSKVPTTGPVFFAVNHPNAMVDALVVATVVPRRVGFTAKSTIFANPVLSAFLHAVGVVPLKRAADMAKETAIKATGDSGVNHSVTPGASGNTKVHSDASLDNTSAKAAAQAIDPARNADSFRAVSAAMAEGKAIVVFPEGISHDAPHLAPLRTGLARMALQARDSLNVRGIQIIPVGLLFERKEEPRSRVLVQIGEPIDVDSFALGAQSVETLTGLIGKRLAAVTLNFETPEDAARIQVIGETIAALIEPVTDLGDGGPPLSAVLAISRRAERVRQRLAGDATAEFRGAVVAFESRLEAFRMRLRAEHIVLADLLIDVGATPGARFAVRESLLAAFLTPISWWGRLTHYVPLRIARTLAVRNSHNRDEPAMNTIVIGLGLVLASYALQTAFVWAIVGAKWAIVFLATLIPSASSDLRYGDRVERRTQRMRTYLRFRDQPALREELLAEADWLRRQAGVIEASSQ